MIGEHTLGEKMKNIRRSKTFQVLHKLSIRAAAVTILDKSAFEARTIMAVSRYKNETRIHSYGETDICTEKKMSETLQSVRL